MREAVASYQLALPLWRAANQRQGEVWTLSSLGLTCLLMGESQEALEYLDGALPFLRAAGDRKGEAAARIKCTNNLKQFTLACHNYHDANGQLPIGSQGRNSKDPDWAYTGSKPRTPFVARLMPYIEQTAFAAHYDMTKNFNSPPNTAIITYRFPIFDCPSDTAQATGHPQTGDLKSNYGVNWGSWSFRQQGGPTNGTFPLNYGDQKGRAPFYIDITIKLTDIADGTSNTLCWSEVIQTPWDQPSGQAFVEALKKVLPDLDAVLGKRQVLLRRLYRRALRRKTIRVQAPQPGRNDPCPCGSGKKYKKCCGA